MSTHALPDGHTRVYLPGYRAAHIVRPDGIVAEAFTAALCGAKSPGLGGWRGTGNQDEHDRAAALPLCRRCAEELFGRQPTRHQLAELRAIAAGHVVRYADGPRVGGWYAYQRRIRNDTRVALIRLGLAQAGTVPLAGPPLRYPIVLTDAGRRALLAADGQVQQPARPAEPLS